VNHHRYLGRIEFGAARGSRNLVSALATPRSQPLSYGRELVDLWVVETHDDLLAKQHR
jgi:hypothetical protein